MNARDDTQDIRRYQTQRTADPEALEARTRRWGRIAVIAGLGLCVGTVVESLGMATATENGLFISEAGRLFGLMAFVVQMMIGGFLLNNGSNEMRHRPERERHRQVQLLVQRLTIEHRENYESLTGLIAAVPGRLAAVEDGQRRLVDVLPEEIQRKYWAGYTDAARDGFKATGTEGGSKRRHMGLVSPPEEPRR